MKWSYTDNRGVEQTGTVEKTVDRGGTDITYFFRRDTGELDVISGPYLKRTGGHPIYPVAQDA